MIRLTRTATLLASLCLLASAATATAECAWVLWESDLLLRGEELSNKLWSILESTATLPECKERTVKRVENRVQRAKKEGVVYTVDGTTITLSDDRPTFIKLVSYICIPDTVDPRGPKGAK